MQVFPLYYALGQTSLEILHSVLQFKKDIGKLEQVQRRDRKKVKELETKSYKG